MVHSWMAGSWQISAILSTSACVGTLRRSSGARGAAGTVISKGCMGRSLYPVAY